MLILLNGNTSVAESSLTDESVDQNTFTSRQTVFSGLFQYITDTIFIVSCQLISGSSVAFGYFVIVSKLHVEMIDKELESKQQWFVAVPSVCSRRRFPERVIARVIFESRQRRCQQWP